MIIGSFTTVVRNSHEAFSLVAGRERDPFQFDEQINRNSIGSWERKRRTRGREREERERE